MGENIKEFVVLDLETTGLSKYYHKITEIAAVRVLNGEINEKFQTLVNPQTPIPRFITKLTGITNEMVADAPKIDSALSDFTTFLGSSTFIAHNATFDHGFLEFNLKKHLDIDFENKRLCTKKLATRILEDLPSKKLSCICEHFDLVNEQAHRAMSDVEVTKEVFLKFLDILKESNIEGEDKVLRFESLPKSRAIGMLKK